MKSLLRLTILATASAIALLATGCAKKPTTRPNPSMTLGTGGAELQTTQLGDPDLEGRTAMGPVDFDTFQAYTVYFDFDSAALKQAERAKVQAVADHMKSNPGARLMLEGHCDWRGTSEYNLGLGDRRANSVRSYLGQLGVDASRIETVSKGDLDAKEGASEADMRLDRRVNIGLVR